MRDLITVAVYTMKDMLKRKSFIVSTIFILVMIVVGFNIPNIINAVSSDTSVEHKILIVDENNIFEGALSSLNDMETFDNTFEIIKTPVKFDEIKKQIEVGEIDSAFVIKKDREELNITYYVENMAMMDSMPEEYINAITDVYTNLQIGKLNLTPQQLESLTPNFIFDVKQTSDKEVSGNVFAIMLLSIVLFYAIYFCAYQVSTSITIEKTSKIIETLVTSTNPRTIVLGKTIGIGIVGLLQVILIISVALISANLFLEQDLINSIVDVSKFTPQLAVLTIVYSLLYALTGSTVSKPEDVQSANGPVAILAVIGFYLAYFTMMNPASELNMFASIFPLSAPFCMPFRVMMGVATLPEILISIGVMLGTILIIAKISIKIYSQAILNYGSKLSFKDILNMYKEKE